MAETFGTATAFVLQELPANAPGARTVELFGRALPYRPMAIGGSMRAQVDWYPGNPVATTQILGPEEDVINVKGTWKDRFIRAGSNSPDTAIARVNGVQVEDSYALFVVFDEMRRQGRYVRLTWDLLIREGFIEKFVGTFERHEDIEWDLTFRVTSQGDTFAPAVISSTTDLASSISDWYKVRNALAQATAAVPFRQALAFAQRFTSVLNQIEDGINAIVDSVSATSTLALSVPSNARRLAGIAQGVQDSATALSALVGAQPPMSAFIVDHAPTFGDYITAQTYLQQFVDIGRSARAQAARQRQQFIAQVQPDLIGQFIARDNTDLRDVSRFYYGTPDQWRTLMLFNGFITSALSAPDLVLVPKIGSVSTDPTSA